MTAMHTEPLKARVINGRLVLDAPTNLPEGAEVELAVVDGDNQIIGEIDQTMILKAMDSR